VATGKKLATLKFSPAKAGAGSWANAAFSADGKRVTVTSQHDARTWEASTGQELAGLEQGGASHAAAFSPDGQRLVTVAPIADGRESDPGASRQSAIVWDLGSRRKLLEVEQDGYVHGAAFSPDGKLLLIQAEGKSLDLYDVASGRTVAQLRDPHGRITGTFSSDGASLLTIYMRSLELGHPGSNASFSARIWPVDPLAEAMKRKPRELTAAERKRFAIDGR
jgi:WD40 repeat protein